MGSNLEDGTHLVWHQLTLRIVDQMSSTISRGTHVDHTSSLAAFHLAIPQAK